MKKIILLFVAAALMVACGGSSVEEKAIDFLQKIEKASDNYDFKSAEEIAEEMYEWLEGLSEEDQYKVEIAVNEYYGKAAEGNKAGHKQNYEYADDDEAGYVEESGNNWDEILDEYEEYVDDAIRLYKKGMNGDMGALSEYTELAEKAQSLSEKISDSYSSLNMSQVNRLSEISQKLAGLAGAEVDSYSSSSYTDDNDWDEVDDYDDDDYDEDDYDDDDDDDDWGDDEW